MAAWFGYVEYSSIIIVFYKTQRDRHKRPLFLFCPINFHYIILGLCNTIQYDM